MKNITVRKISMLPLFVFLLLSLDSCKKEAAPITYKIQGLWVGTIGNPTSTAQPYALSIKANGQITFEGYAANTYHFGTGTWTLNGDSFTANVTTLYGISSNVGVQQKLEATFNSSTGILNNGKYVNTSPANDAGTFSVTKVN
ncbi:hypothetical protein [Lacibacter sediminis]|uniref:Lipocalin-like domain-containing protein n=1 Tax=Lacibacter sediminis TaxID=2760713 RepID=A0A7G5XDH1_9BACT|nr:hypothetical protein [Lacibacter sediminis]QNA43524.1 hypothetical protein H4075_15760 [Lacibacter sediminis]